MGVKCQVLIIADDAQDRRANAGILRHAGYVVCEASDCREAIHMLKEVDQPDVFLIAMNASGTAGLEILEKLDMHNRLARAIVLTDHENMRDAWKAELLGAFGYLIKPVRAETLIGEVRRAQASVQKACGKLERVTQLNQSVESTSGENETIQAAIAERDLFIDGVLSSIQEGILAVDCDGHVVYMNNRAQEILGLSFWQCAGERIVSALHDRTWVGQLEAMIQPDAPASVWTMISIPGDTGGAHHYLVGNFHFHRGSETIVGRILNFVDQTSKVEAERMRDFFLSAVAHELRTPVTIVKNYLEIMKRNRREEENWLDMIADMASASYRQISLIDKIIALSSLSDVRYESVPDDIDVAGLVQGLLTATRAEALEKNLRVQVEDRTGGGRVRIDPKLLSTAVSCLLSNAVKFNRSGGSVTISIFCEKGEGRENLVVQVADTGIGITPQVRQNLFTGFMQGENPLTRHYAGIGMGLYLAKRAVDILGARISVASVEGAGSTFTLTIPVPKRS